MRDRGRLETIAAGVFQVDPGTIDDRTSPENLAAWDSFSGLLLVSELESAFGVSFTMDEVQEVKCIGDLRAALERRGVKPGDS